MKKGESNSENGRMETGKWKKEITTYYADYFRVICDNQYNRFF